MDEFTTPQPGQSNSVSMKFLSKSGLLDLLREVDFNGVYLPGHVVSDDIQDTQSFVKVVCESLNTELLRNALNHSPQKLLDSTPVASLDTDPESTPSGIKLPTIKLYSPQGRHPSLLQTHLS